MKLDLHFFSLVKLFILIGLFEINILTWFLKKITFIYLKTSCFVNVLKEKIKKYFLVTSSKKAKKYVFAIRIKYFLAGVLMTLVILFVYNSYFFIEDLPSPKLIGKINYPVSTQIFDRNGLLLYEIYKNENRVPISLSKIPKHVIQATIAMEDKQFYQHAGVSLISGIARAIFDSIQTGSLQGGSTITQQLVKSALLSPERTIIRKIKEIILALWTERIYTKDEILEMYLNQVPYGGSAYGIEQAAKIYFGKHVWELSLEEGAMLAGLPQAPSIYSPHINPKNANARKNEVLRLMFNQHYIDEKQYKESIQKKVSIIPFSQPIRAPHFVFYVRSEMEKKYGTRQVEEGGFQVITSLDFRTQEKAQTILSQELSKVEYLNIKNGAILITKPSTGEILTMVGSKDYFDKNGGAFNVVSALRQPGSSIKPLLYSLAIERKILTPASILDDSPVTYIFPGSETYKPVNYDGRFHGNVPMRYALANSYNIPAVKTINMIGVNDFIEHAKDMGISTWADSGRYGLSLSLGAGEVTMLDMAVAYGVFANMGYRVDLDPFIKIKNHKGKIIYSKEGLPKKKVISRETAFIINDILSDNFARQFAFGRNSQLEIPGKKVAVKTGTTDLKKDNWTIGYTKDYVVVTWVGNNDNSPMNQYLASGVTGAAPIWNKTVTYLENEYFVEKTNSIAKNSFIGAFASKDNEDIFSPPESLIKKKCYYGRDEYFISGTEKNMCGYFLTPSLSPTDR